MKNLMVRLDKVSIGILDQLIYTLSLRLYVQLQLSGNKVHPVKYAGFRREFFGIFSEKLYYYGWLIVVRL